MRYFLDTSALAKLYVQEAGSDLLLDLAGNSEHSFVLLSLARVEFHSAIRRRQRDRSLTRTDAEEILESFEAHWNGFYTIQPVGDAVLSLAVDVLGRRPLRAYDALQLAGGLATPQATFTCSDQTLLQAARDESLIVLNPEA